MKIAVRVREDFSGMRSLEKAIEALNFSNDIFFYELRPYPSQGGRGPVEPLSEMARLKAAHGDPQAGDVFVLDVPFTDNYFSHDSAEVSILTTHEWERRYAPPPLHAYLAYQLAQAAAFFAAGLSWDAGLTTSHVESIGCCFDHCLDKRDIRFGLSAGMLCYSCEGALRAYSVSDDEIRAIRKMLDQVRFFSIGRVVPIRPDSVFLVQRFSQNDENANSVRYGIVPALEDLALTPIRGDSEISRGSLVRKICRQIEEASAVIAKIDERNLNVYFELGYAAALDKPVFLVCRREGIGELPTDLKGWELVEYASGDYEGLRAEMRRHLCSIERFAQRAKT